MNSTSLALLTGLAGGGAGALMPAKDWKRRVANAFAGLLIGGGSGFALGEAGNNASPGTSTIAKALMALAGARDESELRGAASKIDRLHDVQKSLAYEQLDLAIADKRQRREEERNGKK